MSVDVACAGTPFLDLIFRGLPRLPGPGEEVLASDVAIVPGGMANVAFGLRQLGLDAVVCAPVGTDPAGRLLAELMVEAGIPWIGPPASATPISVGLPFDGDRAYATVAPEVEIDVEAVVALAPRAIVVDLPIALRFPSGPPIFAVVGDPEVALLRGRLPESLAGLRALLANEREACLLAEAPAAEAAATILAGRGCLAVVTLGAGGAVAVRPDGAVFRTAAIAGDPVDTVGAGDLFTAAFVWADLLGRSVQDGLEVAAAYASLSLAAESTRQKGLAVEAFRLALVASAVGRSEWLVEGSR
jgi:sugar/nucleoside kinase (ribokinase family)